MYLTEFVEISNVFGFTLFFPFGFRSPKNFLISTIILVFNCCSVHLSHIGAETCMLCAEICVVGC